MTPYKREREKECQEGCMIRTSYCNSYRFNFSITFFLFYSAITLFLPTYDINIYAILRLHSTKQYKALQPIQWVINYWFSRHIFTK